MDYVFLSRLFGVDALPEMPSDFSTDQAVRVSVADASLIERLEKEYGLLGVYLEPVCACARAVAEEPILCEWSARVLSYIASHSLHEAAYLPVLRPCGEVYSYYELLLIVSLLPSGIDAYRKRGFSETEIKAVLCPSIRDRASVSEDLNGCAGLDGAGFRWLLHYTKALVFPAGIFNITPRRMYEPSILLRNRQSGEYAVLVLSGKFHRTGMQLGSGGCKDEEGAFDADFRETEDAFIGCEVTEGARLLPTRRICPKSEWQEIVRQGDGIVGIHIPRGASLTDENIAASFKEAFRLSCERYPEVNVRAVHCSSWILDPQLETLLGETSKIAGFGRQFLRYPMGGDGGAVYPFVFRQKKPADLSDLREDTTLQRKIKALYREGGCIYITGGFVAADELSVF